jgi:hypothetical protein
VPMVAPALGITDHAAVFRDLCDHQRQFRHFQPSLTGLIVLPNQRRANIARRILDSVDNTTLSRLLAEAPWREDAVNRRRIRFMRQQTKPHRRGRRASLVVLEATLCGHVGSLLDDVNRHSNPSDGTYPLAHTPVTSLSGSGLVRFPLGRRLSRRDAAVIPGEAWVAHHCPALQIPTDPLARHRVHPQVDPVLLQAPEFRARQERCRTKIPLATDLVEEAIRQNGPCGVVVFDARSLAEEVVRGLARRRKDGSSRRNKNRRLDTASFHRRDANGWAMPLIPAQAYRPIAPSP